MGRTIAGILIGMFIVTTAAAEQRFEIRSDGASVLDTQTGLEWMRCSVGQEWDSGADDCVGEPATYTWTEATEVTAMLGGHSDWRLPGRDELNTLVLCSSGQREGFVTEGMFAGNGGRCQGDFKQPAIDQQVFPSTPWEEAFWTADKLEDAPVRHAWVVGFGTGYVNDIAYSAGREGARPHVRLVRQ